MRSLLVLLSLVAFASCSPTLGFLSGILGGATSGGCPVEGALKSVAGGAGGIGGGNPIGGILGAAGGAPGVGGISGGLPGGAGGLPGGAGGLFGGARPGGRTDRGYQQEGGVYPVGGGGIFQGLAFLSQGLTDVTGNANSIIRDILNLDFPAALDDGFNSIISVGRACGGIINAVLPGLGTLFGNLVVSIAKIFICVFGSPGLSGGILGDRTPGRDNPRDIPYICSPQYGSKWGCAYDGPYDNPDTIINHYGIKNAKTQVLDYINKYTNGAGVDSLDGSPRVISNRILRIATIMDKGSNIWTDDDIRDLVINIIIINAAIGESYQPGLGIRIVDEWITTLKKNNKNQRFPDISKHRPEIIEGLKGTKENRWGGAFNQSKRDGWKRLKNTQNDNQLTETNNNSDNERRDTEKNSNTDNSDSTDRDTSNNESRNTDTNSITRKSDRTDNNESNNERNDNDNNDSNNGSNNNGSKNKRQNNDNNGSNNNGSGNERENNANNGSKKNGSGNERQNNDNNGSNNHGSDKERQNNENNVSNNNGSDNEKHNNDNNSSNNNKSTKSSDSNTSSDGDDGYSKLRVQNNSENTSQNTDDSSHSKTSSGSGKSIKNADGSSLSAYSYSDAEFSHRSRTSGATDARSHGLAFDRNSDDS